MFGSGVLPEKTGIFLALSLPLAKVGLLASQGRFFDALCLCYGLPPPNLCSHCVRGYDFSVPYALSCSHGPYPILHNNDEVHLVVDCKMVI